MRHLLAKITTAAASVALLAAAALPAAAASPTLPDGSSRYPAQSTSWKSISRTSATTMSLTNTSGYVNLGAPNNNALVAQYTPKSVEHYHTPVWGLVNHPYQVTVDDYAWVKIGDYLPVSKPGATLKYEDYFLTYLYAGNETRQASYGAHNSNVTQLDGTDIYWWFENRCTGEILYTPNYGLYAGHDYSSIGALQRGFWADSPNPFTSSSNYELYARAGVLGGDPLMRWNGSSGFGWYYQCFSTRTYEWKKVGSHKEWRDNWVNEIVSYTDTTKTQNFYDPTTSLAKQYVVSVDNISTMTLRCTNADTSPTENTTISLGNTTGTTYDPRMRIEIVSGTGQATDTVRLVAQTNSKVLYSTSVPSSCYKVSENYSVPGGNPETNPIRPS